MAQAKALLILTMGASIRYDNIVKHYLADTRLMLSPRDVVDRIEQAMADGDWSAAEAGARELFESSPKDAYSQYLLVYVLRQKGDYEAAFEVAEAALQDHPKDLKLLSEMGNVAYAMGEYPKAENAYRTTLRIEPEHREARQGLADLLAATHRLQESQRLLEGLRRGDPEDAAVALSLGWVLLRGDRYGEALGVFEDAEREPGMRYYAKLGSGAVYFAQHRYEESADSFRQAIELERGRPEARVNLAWVLALQGKDLREAAAECERALELDPNFTQALDCLGVLHYRQGEVHLAEQRFREAIERHPNNLGARLRLGILLYHLDDLSAARAQFDQILERDNAYDLAYQARGSLLFKLGMHADALRDFRRAAAINPHLPQPIRGAALALAELGDIHTALALLGSGLRKVRPIDRWQLHQSLARLLVNAGDLLKEQKLYREAVTEVERALREGRTGKELYFLAAVAAGKAKDFKRAEMCLAEVLKRDKNDLKARLYLDKLRELTRDKARHQPVSKRVQTLLLLLSLLQLIGTWFLFLIGKFDSTVFGALAVVYMGLVLVVFFLPRLTRLKLPGFEAELEAVTAISPTDADLELRLEDLPPTDLISLSPTGMSGDLSGEA